MRSIAPEELKTILESHRKWLYCEGDGSRADLRGANLSGADLGGADLSDANLSGANLGYANLRYANLRYANLRGADLSDANLRGANLSRANLSGANLSRANLSDADLSGADLGDAILGGAEGGIASLITIPSLHRKMLAAIESGGTLEMSTWHSCETTHCRAGWAIHLAGAAGRVLEWSLGPAAAGALIHVASCPQLDGKVPYFYASNEDALADIRRLAALEPELETV